METRTTALSVTFFSCALLAGLLQRTPQTLYGDPSYQLKAMQQFLSGESSSMNRLTTPDPKNLTQDTTEWFSWWPPGAQLLVYPLASRGMPIGTAVRSLTIGLIILGCFGWVLWFHLFNLPTWIQLSWALFIPWMRYVSNNFFAFSAEAIAFALAPWILWCSDSLAKASARRQNDSAAMITAAAVLGFGMGSGYVLKYSIVFVSLAALLYLRPQLRIVSFAALVLGFLIPVAALNTLNYVVSHDMNPVVSTAGFHWKMLSIPWIAALSALAMTDGYSLLDYVFLHPVHGLFKQEILVCLLGLPGGMVLLWLLFGRRTSSGPARLAIMALAIMMAAMLVIWNLTRVGNYDGRYLAVFSLAVLPVALEEGFILWRSKRGLRWKMGLAAAGFTYVLVPLLYGVVSVAVKAARLPSNYQFGPSHLYNGFLAGQDLAGVRERLLHDYHRTTDLWYLPDPLTALDIPGRAIICFADFTEIAELQAHPYRSPMPMRIRMLLPPRFELNGKGSVIRGSFPQAGDWSRREIPGCGYTLWETVLRTP